MTCSGHEFPAEEFSLGDDRCNGSFPHVGWVTVPPKYALDHAAEVGAALLADGPVDAGVAADGLGDLAGDNHELGVAEDGLGRLVLTEGVVEGELVFSQVELLTTTLCRLDLAGELDQLLDDLDSLDGAVVVAS